jgi:hypothetical protein
MLAILHSLDFLAFAVLSRDRAQQSLSFWQVQSACSGFPTLLRRLAEDWQLFVGVAIVAIILLLALWYQFDPAVVRFNDFHNDQMSL